MSSAGAKMFTGSSGTATNRIAATKATVGTDLAADLHLGYLMVDAAKVVDQTER